MKSETITIQHLFQDRRQFCVPFYQRSYVWTLDDQWEQLWDDIREKAEVRVKKQKPTPHFLGAIVIDPQQREGLIGVDILHIIDGQQRLSTLQFVLASILMVVRMTSQSKLAEPIRCCVRNGSPETMIDPAVEQFKVWPTFRDRQNYTSALDAQDLEDLQSRFSPHFTQAGELRKIGIDHPPALAALWYFTRSVETWVMSDQEQIPARMEALVTAALQDLKVVTIMLEQEDDAQIIFETLNGRGAQLHATDLIRNYLFMRADREKADSELLYDTLWSQFETDYWATEQRRGRIKKPRLEWLIHAQLQAELHEEVDLGRLYFEFRRFSTGEEPQSTEQLLLRLADYSEHYKELIGGSGTKPIARFGRRIVPYDITTLHPLALAISTATISNPAKVGMFDDLVSYLVRRAVCGLTPKNYNNVFLALLRQLRNGEVSQDSLRNALSKLSGEASRWPTDGEFRNACLTAPVYYGRLDAPKMRAVLTEIEAYLRAAVYAEEPIVPDLSGLDVDHIMPRSWFTHWSLEDGTTATSTEAYDVELLARIGGELNSHQKLIAERQSRVQTLGNLTLLNLSVNREAQHYAFPNKRDLLIANTTLRLNVPLISKESWDENEIYARGEILADAALEIWPGPSQESAVVPVVRTVFGDF